MKSRIVCIKLPASLSYLKPYPHDMGFLDAITGMVSEIDSDEAESELEPIFIEDEVVEVAFVIYRDMMMIFTNRRLVLVDNQGLTGNKISYESVPYKSIHRFEVETASSFDMDAELTLWIRGRQEPFYQELSKDIDTAKVDKLIVNYVL